MFKGKYMQCLIYWNKEKNIHELITDESEFTQEEIEINDKVLIVRK